MPYNGTGTFNRVYSWVADAAAGILIRADRTDQDSNDIASGLTNCVTRDGQSPPTADLPMGSHKLTGLAAGSTNGDSVRYEQLTANVPNGVNDMRLTLTSLTPVTTTDVLAATTLYWARYKGSRCSLFDGISTWTLFNTGDIAIAVPATTNQMYDVFVYNNAGSPTLELLAWTNDTTRATAIAFLQGVLVKSGDSTRRYVGSFRTTGVSGQTEDSRAKRYVWNYYNRVQRPMTVGDNSVFWIYSTVAIRQARGSAANQLDFVVGVAEDAMEAGVIGVASVTSPTSASVGIGYDSTTTYHADCVYSGTNANGVNVPLLARLELIPDIGRHVLCWNENVSNVAGATFSGTGAGNTGRSGINGRILG